MEEVQKATRVAGAARKDQSALAKRLNKETILRTATEAKLVHAEVEFAELRTRQAEMECKEEVYHTTMKQMRDKADRTLKIWIESDSIQVNEMQ